MRFVHRQEIDPAQAVQIFRQSPWYIFIAFLMIWGADVAVILWHVLGDLPLLIAIPSGLMLTLVGLLCFRTLRCCLGADNWVLARLPDGLAVKLVSYQRRDVPAAADILRLDFDEVRRIRGLTERRSLEKARGTRCVTFSHLIIEVDSDIESLRQRLKELRTQTGSFKIHHYPVTVDREGLLRICWRSEADRIVPGLKKTLASLDRCLPGGVELEIRKGGSTENAAPGGSDAAVDDEILSLVESGRTIAAVHLCRKHYGMSLSEAKAFVDDLARG